MTGLSGNAQHQMPSTLVNKFQSLVIEDLNIKDLLSILERVHAGDKLTAVVAYRDHLGRFGTKLIETLLERNGGELVVLNQREFTPSTVSVKPPFASA